MTTQTEASRALVMKFVEAFGGQRFDDAQRLLHDEFVAHAAGDVPYSGDYRGSAGFLELVTKMSGALEVLPTSEMHFIADGHTVVLHYRLRFTGRASGESAEMSMSEVFTIRDGLILELDVFYKNPAAVQALLAQ
ncbi:nuclear transport factor 2 family protein [Mycobacterium sp. RTGN5]|uniref:nuclear transport factor 2 family protein n=1 Tax=Mycobacterium sp. RTGN5 TaxID=3016522 RepID=UPI0029C7DECF|nr:nuclear transport factor 2 family protein [Mycobacterium sp. RTGN5]